MKNLIFILSIFISGCYIEPDKVIVHYYVNAENTLTINYKTLDCEKTILSKNLDVYFEVRKDDTPEYFKYKLEIISEVKQPIYILIEFNDEIKRDEIFYTDYYIEDAIYCPDWYNKCSNVSIGF